MIKKYLSLIFALLLINLGNAQQKIDQDLKAELNEILRLDQSYRMLFDNTISSTKKDSVLKSLNTTPDIFQKKGWGLVLEQDSINIKKIETIISKYGYPGKTMVGEPTNKSAWYVIQHSNKISKYLPIIKAAAEKKEIPFKNYATMLDRYLMENKQEQIYGTQGFGSYHLNADGKEEWIDLIWPVKNLAEANSLRKKVGFTQTIEEYAKDLYGEDFVFKNYKLKDAKKISEYKKVF